MINGWCGLHFQVLLSTIFSALEIEHWGWDLERLSMISIGRAWETSVDYQWHCQAPATSTTMTPWQSFLCHPLQSTPSVLLSDAIASNTAPFPASSIILWLSIMPGEEFKRSLLLLCYFWLVLNKALPVLRAGISKQSPGGQMQPQQVSLWSTGSGLLD